MNNTSQVTALHELLETAAGLAVLADARDAASVQALASIIGRMATALSNLARPVAAAACQNLAQALATGSDPQALESALTTASETLTNLQVATRENRDLSPQDTAPSPEQSPLSPQQPSGQAAHPANKQAATPSAPIAQPGRYLVFRLGREEFGIDILKVQEIVNLLDITRVPHTHPCLKGVCNLRGQVIPVVDWRIKFDMPEAQHTEKTCMIVVNVTHNDKPTIIATILDEVTEAVDARADDIVPPPAMGASVSSRFLSGMAKINDRIIMLLDVVSALSLEELKGY